MNEITSHLTEKNVNNIFSISEVEKRWAGPVLDSVDAAQVPPNVRRRSRDTSSITSQRISQLAHRISAFVDEGTCPQLKNMHVFFLFVWDDIFSNMCLKEKESPGNH